MCGRFGCERTCFALVAGSGKLVRRLAWEAHRFERSSPRGAVLHKLVCSEQNAYIQAMSSTLFLVEIRSWDWPLHVGVRPRSASPEHSPEEDLLCVEAVAIDGLVLAPEEHRSKLMHIELFPLPREIIFGDRDARDVGRLHKDPVERGDLGFAVNLFLPADTLQSTIFCLGSTWRRIHMWVDDGVEPLSVSHFGFSSDAQIVSSDPMGAT